MGLYIGKAGLLGECRPTNPWADATQNTEQNDSKEGGSSKKALGRDISSTEMITNKIKH